MSGHDPDTIAFYDQEGATYAKWSAPKGSSPWLEKFLSLIDAPSPADARLLDYGCGGGWAAKRMVEGGYQVEAFDGSASLAEEAAKLTGLNVAVMRFEAFTAEARFDGIWSSFCLLHAPKAAMPVNLGGIARALKPGGRLYLGLKQGDGERRDKIGRFYSYFGADEITRLLTDAGFTGIDIRERGGAGYDGSDETMMHIFCRKSDG